MEAAGDKGYEYFSPHFKWDREEISATLTVLLSGFRGHQLKVDLINLTSNPSLRISGERQILENRWVRFDKEFPIPPDCDIDNVSAKFEGGLLYVKFPILTQETIGPPEEAPSPQQPRAEAPPQEVDQQKAASAQESIPKAKEDKAEKSTNEVSEKRPKKGKEPKYEKEKCKIETAASKDKLTKKKVRRKGLTDQTEAGTSKVPEMNGAKTVTRPTPSLGPANLEYNQAVGDLDIGINKRKKLMNWAVAILLVVILWLFVRNAFRSSLGGSKFQEL